MKKPGKVDKLEPGKAKSTRLTIFRNSAQPSNWLGPKWSRLNAKVT
jgi:hypothetical protein